MVLSIVFSVMSMVVIEFSWAENEIVISKKSISRHYGEALRELKKRDVLSIGIAESCFLAVQNIFLFAWTPILLATNDNKSINVGFIFICLVTTLIIGTKSYEVCIIYHRLQRYLTLSMCILLSSVCYFCVYSIENYIVRLIFLSMINGITGMFNPLNSVIKSNILEEKHRALLMNIFRIPLNFYVILILLLLRYINPFTVNIFIYLALLDLRGD